MNWKDYTDSSTLGNVDLLNYDLYLDGTLFPLVKKQARTGGHWLTGYTYEDVLQTHTNANIVLCTSNIIECDICDEMDHKHTPNVEEYEAFGDDIMPITNFENIKDDSLILKWYKSRNSNAMFVYAEYTLNDANFKENYIYKRENSGFVKLGAPHVVTDFVLAYTSSTGYIRYEIPYHYVSDDGSTYIDQQPYAYDKNKCRAVKQEMPTIKKYINNEWKSVGRLPNDYNEKYTRNQYCDPLSAPRCSPCYNTSFTTRKNFTFTCVTTMTGLKCQTMET